MDVRFARSPEEVRGFTTTDLRREFLVPEMFVSGEIRATYSHHDRVVIAGITPADSPLVLTSYDQLRTEHFFTSREAGVVNVGDDGIVTVDGASFSMTRGGCLYIGRGAREVSFEPSGDGEARFYLFSAPAHADYPTTALAPGEGTLRELGDPLTSNERTINQYIHEGGIQSCQVVMGVTTLAPGSMWNTMPSHTHDRRTECYLYFDVPEDARVVHLMGEPAETRHLIVANDQGIISPSWSIHSGVGTSAYSFVWAMAGENKAFDDMDPFPVTELS